MVLTCAMVSYFAMATGLGITYIPTKVEGANPENLHLFRQVYYARASFFVSSSIPTTDDQDTLTGSSPPLSS